MKTINLSGFKRVEKAYQEGIYSDSPANKKLGRVGMTYKQAAEKAAKEESEEKPEAAKSKPSEKKSKEAEIHNRIMGLKRGDFISIHEDAKYGEGRGSVSLDRAKYKILSQDTRGKEGELQAKEFEVKDTLTKKTSYLSSHILEFLLEDNNLSINGHKKAIGTPEEIVSQMKEQYPKLTNFLSNINKEDLSKMTTKEFDSLLKKNNDSPTRFIVYDDLGANGEFKIFTNTDVLIGELNPKTKKFTPFKNYKSKGNNRDISDLNRKRIYFSSLLTGK